jgi:tRNA (guanine-N7-)-methyltransferase
VKRRDPDERPRGPRPARPAGPVHPLERAPAPEPAGGDDEDEDGAGDEAGADETDHGVPFPGALVAPELRTQGQVVVPRDARFDWKAAFGRDDAPRVVDLGCGNGRYLLLSALARPTHDHLGVDLVPHAIRHAARRAGERGLANLKYGWGDGLGLLFQGLDRGSVDEVHVYHPQPYYDPGQTSRRMLTPQFFGRVWEVLRPGTGLLVLQTDNPYYWRYVQKVAPRLFRWTERDGPWPDAPEGRTRREVFARSRGLTIFRATGTPRAINPKRVRHIVRHLPPPVFDANRPRFRGQ